MSCSQVSNNNNHVVSVLPHLTVSEFFNTEEHESLWTSPAAATTTTVDSSSSSAAAAETSDGNGQDDCFSIGLVWIDASWANNSNKNNSAPHERMRDWIASATRGLQVTTTFTASLLICERTDPDGYDAFIDRQPQPKQQRQQQQAPNQLPTLAVVVRQIMPTKQTSIRYLNHRITPTQLRRQQEQEQQQDTTTTEDDNNDAIGRAVRGAVYELEEELSMPIVFPTACQEAVRVFVAGDRSSVGKSSICLGILGTLLRQYDAMDLAYIKPATQDESTQLIQVFCQQHGIKCVPIGPLVYYRGFTRAFLSGEALRSEHWLELCAAAVDRVARNKKVVLVDGVGFPAVGSICGTDNAQVAKACGYPTIIQQDDDDNNNDTGPSVRVRRRHPMGVVLVGGSGVGSAVDGYNLNKAYFERAGVPVLGAIFNKLATTGFYSLENCREQVTKYFDQACPQQRPFGFVPLFPQLAAPGPRGIRHVPEFIDLFQLHVDVQGIYDAAVSVRNSLAVQQQPTTTAAPAKKIRPADMEEQRRAHYKGLPFKGRHEIEKQAIHSGAPPSA